MILQSTDVYMVTHTVMESYYTYIPSPVQPLRGSSARRYSHSHPGSVHWAERGCQPPWMFCAWVNESLLYSPTLSDRHPSDSLWLANSNLILSAVLLALRVSTPGWLWSTCGVYLASCDCEIARFVCNSHFSHDDPGLRAGSFPRASSRRSHIKFIVPPSRPSPSADFFFFFFFSPSVPHRQLHSTRLSSSKLFSLTSHRMRLTYSSSSPTCRKSAPWKCVVPPERALHPAIRYLAG